MLDFKTTFLAIVRKGLATAIKFSPPFVRGAMYRDRFTITEGGRIQMNRLGMAYPRKYKADEYDGAVQSLCLQYAWFTKWLLVGYRSIDLLISSPLSPVRKERASI